VIAFTNHSGVNFGWRGGIKINVSPVLGSALLRRGYPTIVVAWHTQRVFSLLGKCQDAKNGFVLRSVPLSCRTMKPDNSFGVCAALRCVIADCYLGKVPLVYARRTSDCRCSVSMIPLMTPRMKDGESDMRMRKLPIRLVRNPAYDCASYEEPIDT
jgi:hypothetical protein